MNTKILHKVFWFGIFLPVALMFFLDGLTNLLKIRASVMALNNLSYILLGISFIASIFLIYKNFQTKINRPVWYILGVVFIIASAGLFYVIESLSHFGF